MIGRIIGIILSLLLIYGAYTETGIWTAISLLLIYVGIELRSAVIRKIIDRIS